MGFCLQSDKIHFIVHISCTTEMSPMKELRENGYKKISLSTEEPVPAQFFDIPGIANLEQNQNSISFMFNGNVMTIMEKLHKLPLVDILIEEPSLEEIFLHYYE